MKRLAPDYNPRRKKCPGCGSKDRLKESPLSAKELRQQGLRPLCCPRCFRHVWDPRGTRLKGAPKALSKSRSAVPRRSA